MKKTRLRKVLITGGTSGLGLELGRLFLERGCEVYATGRKLRADAPESDRFFFIEADFSKLHDVKGIVKKLTEQSAFPDLIINNAGILSPPDFTLSEDGFEISFQVNFLSHLVLNDLFIKQMSDNSSLMIVSVSSPVHKYISPEFRMPEANSYEMFRVYSGSKYYMLLLGEYFSGRYPGKNIDFSGFNPGTFRSGIYRMQKKYFRTLYRVAAPFMRDPSKVARYMIRMICSDSPDHRVIFNYPGKRESPLPALTSAAEELFLSCEAAVNIMR